MRYLVVSSDAYNTAFGDRRVITVEVDSHAVHQGTYREPIIDADTAHLDGSEGGAQHVSHRVEARRPAPARVRPRMIGIQHHTT